MYLLCVIKIYTPEPVTKPVRTEGEINFISDPTRNRAMAINMTATANEMTGAICVRT
jgi:hypothetical protein